MRKGLIVAVVGLMLLTGLGVAVAQLAEDEPLDLEVPTEPTTTTTAAPVTTVPETAAIADPGATAAPKKVAAPTTTTKPPTMPAVTTQPAGTSPGMPPIATVPTYPIYPYEPAPTAPHPEGKVVQPRPGMDNVHKAGWESVEILSATKVRVHFWSGVEPCSVLDHVDVAYGPGAITITLFEGSDPAAQNVACIMIAQAKAVDVNLAEPVNGRKFVDGSVGNN